MKLLEVVAPTPDIYHGCPTWKIFWGKNFTPANMKGRGRRSVRKHKEIIPWDTKDAYIQNKNRERKIL